VRIVRDGHSLRLSPWRCRLCGYETVRRPFDGCPHCALLRHEAAHEEIGFTTDDDGQW
jgi:predicted Zn-ribbon and HTH transcriptional regulator